MKLKHLTHIFITHIIYNIHLLDDPWIINGHSTITFLHRVPCLSTKLSYIQIPKPPSYLDPKTRLLLDFCIVSQERRFSPTAAFTHREIAAEKFSRFRWLLIVRLFQYQSSVTVTKVWTIRLSQTDDNSWKSCKCKAATLGCLLSKGFYRSWLSKKSVS